MVAFDPETKMIQLQHFQATLTPVDTADDQQGECYDDYGEDFEPMRRKFELPAEMLEDMQVEQPNAAVANGSRQEKVFVDFGSLMDVRLVA